MEDRVHVFIMHENTMLSSYYTSSPIRLPNKGDVIKHKISVHYATYVVKSITWDSEYTECKAWTKKV